jgi:hypothetical protein
VLPVAFISSSSLISGAGGLAAAIAIGAFLGQGWAVFGSTSEETRRRRTTTGGLAGLIAIIGLILVSMGAR